MGKNRGVANFRNPKATMAAMRGGVNAFPDDRHGPLEEFVTKIKTNSF
jgi:hypothetical protein